MDHIGVHIGDKSDLGLGLFQDGLTTDVGTGQVECGESRLVFAEHGNFFFGLKGPLIGVEALASRVATRFQEVSIFWSDRF